MGVILHLTALTANIDSEVDPPVESGEFVVPYHTLANTLALALRSLGYEAESSPTPTTTPGHGLVHLDEAVNPTTYSTLLQSGHLLKRALGSAQRQPQPLNQQPPSR